MSWHLVMSEGRTVYHNRPVTDRVRLTVTGRPEGGWHWAVHGREDVRYGWRRLIEGDASTWQAARRDAEEAIGMRCSYDRSRCTWSDDAWYCSTCGNEWPVPIELEGVL